jgi:hypothetical protein
MRRRIAEVPVLREHWPQICQRRFQIVFQPFPFGQESGRAVQDRHQAVYHKGAYDAQVHTGDGFDMINRYAEHRESKLGSVPNSSRPLKGAGLLGDLL